MLQTKTRDILHTGTRWKDATPGTSAGILVVRNAPNGPVGASVEAFRTETEESLRARCDSMDRAALRELPVYREYAAYYRRFDKSYHVLMQLESIVLKGKHVPKVSNLVTAMFAAELSSGVLTAGHDLDLLDLPLDVSLASPDEEYALLGKGAVQKMKDGDLRVADRRGVIGSILYGPDDRSPIGPETKNVLYLVYGVPGVSRDAIREHLERLWERAALVSPDAVKERLDILTAGE